MRLTEAGKAFLIEAEEISNQLENSLERFHLLQKGYRDKRMIAITPMMVETILPHLIQTIS